ncbi:hypothetical protein MPTK1_8g04945 [Marchantia polymorpha subsp. ruderalis]
MESAGPKSAKYINALLIAATGISILFGIFSFLGYFLVRRNNHKQAGLDSADEEPELPPAVQGLDSADEEPELPPAVQGLDSADEEPELPSAVQDLIRKLDNKTDPLLCLPTLAWPQFQDFFPERASLSTITGWQSQVRLRVLEAIGSCNTLQYLDVHDIFSGDISRLTANEWEVLLRGFSCSTHLRVIRIIERLTWTSLAEVESLCLQLGGILRTSSVTDMTIVDCRLSARCFLNLASGLGGNHESKLKTLELRNAWKDSSAVKHMADMIKSDTRLETLEIGGSSDRMYDMDEEAARILSQAVIQSSSLRKLILREVKGEASAFLLKAFRKKALDGDGGNQAIQCLHLISVFGLGDSLRELLSSNPYLEEVVLAAIDMRPEEWSRLGQAIRENATAKSIRVTHFMRQKDDLKGVEELVCAASSDDKDPKVELNITFYDYDALISALNFVGEVLRGEIRSLESLILYFNCSCPPGSNENRMPSIVPMDENLRDTTVLKRLKLFIQRKDTLKGVWKYLLVCLRNNTSLTQLDLSDSELDDEAFRDLMGLLQKNLTLRAIEVSGTSWQTDGKAALIQQALEQNRKRAEYMAVFPKRPYVTDDVNIFYRMSALMHVGRTFRLHLMCESATRVHIVEDQEGLKICVDLNNHARISKTIEISLKVMYYAVKAGLDVTFGLCQAIPDSADLKSDIVKLDSISNSDRRAVVQTGESEELTEAWLRIRKILGDINYAKIFKLYQVKYEGVESGGHAWVCEECMKEGIRTRILSGN